MKAHGDILREKYPKRKLPRVGYVPYMAVLAMAPALGFRRDFVRCVAKLHLKFSLSVCRNVSLLQQDMQVMSLCRSRIRATERCQKYYQAASVGLAKGPCCASRRSAYGKTWKFDASRAERDLGIKWTPARKAIHDMAAAMLEMVRCCLSACMQQVPSLQAVYGECMLHCAQSAPDWWWVCAGHCEMSVQDGFCRADILETM